MPPRVADDDYRIQRHAQGFLVHDVDRIVRADGTGSPGAMLGGNEGTITRSPSCRRQAGVNPGCGADSRARVRRSGDSDLPAVAAARKPTVFFADDSIVARKEIAQVLDKPA